MGTKYCRVCGEKLSKKNRIPKRNYKKMGNLCNGCRKMQKNQKYKITPKKCTLEVKRGNYRPFKITFASKDDRRSFTIHRKLQIRWGRCHTDPSSFIGKSVDEFVQYMDQDTRTYRQYYTVATCNNAGCGGLIRFDNHGFKVCEVCGIFYQPIAYNIIEFNRRENSVQAMIDHHLPRYDYGHDDETDDNGYTYDVIVSNMYAKNSGGIGRGLSI